MIRITEETGFLSHDLDLLESLEFKQRIKPILGIIEDVNWQDMDPDSLSRFAKNICCWSLLPNWFCHVFFLLLSCWFLEAGLKRLLLVS